MRTTTVAYPRPGSRKPAEARDKALAVAPHSILLPRSILVADVPDSVIMVAAAMEDLDNSDAGCFAAPATIAARLDVAKSTVTEAQVHLRAWTMRRIGSHGRVGRSLRPDDDGRQVRVPSLALYGSHKLPSRLLRALVLVQWCNDVGRKVTARLVATTVRTVRADRSDDANPYGPVSLKTGQNILRKLVKLGWLIQRGTGSDTVYIAQFAPIGYTPTPDPDESEPGDEPAHTPGNQSDSDVHNPGNQSTTGVHTPGNWTIDGQVIHTPTPETGRTAPRQPTDRPPGNEPDQSRSSEYIHVSRSTRACASRRSIIQRPGRHSWNLQTTPTGRRHRPAVTVPAPVSSVGNAPPEPAAPVA